MALHRVVDKIREDKINFMSVFALAEENKVFGHLQALSAYK